MNSIIKLFNMIIPPKLYDTKKHNILAMGFVLLILLIVQYPALFRNPVNSIFGKFVLLMIIILLTNYNILAGLTATVIAIGLYIDLFKTGNEGFVEGMCPDPDNPDNPDCPKPNDEMSTGKVSPAAVGGDVKDTLVTDKFAPAQVIPTPVPPVVPVIPVPVVPVVPVPTMVEKQLNAQQQVASINSNSIPTTLGKSSTVEPFSMNDSAKNMQTVLTPSFVNY